MHTNLQRKINLYEGLKQTLWKFLSVAYRSYYCCCNSGGLASWLPVVNSPSCRVFLFRVSELRGWIPEERKWLFSSHNITNNLGTKRAGVLHNDSTGNFNNKKAHDKTRSKIANIKFQSIIFIHEVKNNTDEYYYFLSTDWMYLQFGWKHENESANRLLTGGVKWEGRGGAVSGRGQECDLAQTHQLLYWGVAQRSGIRQSQSKSRKK